MIKPGDLVCVTRKCCERDCGGALGMIEIVVSIECLHDGTLCDCGKESLVPTNIAKLGENEMGFPLFRLTKIDPLKEPETVEEEAHA